MAQTSRQKTAPNNVFMFTLTSGEIESMNDAAQEIVMLFHGIETDTGKSLRQKITEAVSPQMLFNKATDPYHSFWTKLRRFFAVCRIGLRVHQ